MRYSLAYHKQYISSMDIADNKFEIHAIVFDDKIDIL